MKVKVLGKQHMEGVGKKSGNSYNFNQIHYIGRDPKVEGQACMTMNLDPGIIPFADIAIGAEYNAEYGPFNRIVGFTKIG